MITWRSFEHEPLPKDILRQEASNLLAQAREMPPSIRRDDLIRQARRAETASKLNEWLRSPGLQPPE